MSNRAGLPRLLVAAATALALVGLPAASSFSYAEEPPPPSDQVAVEVTESATAETATDQTVTDEVNTAPAEPAAAEVSVNETTTNEATDASTDQVATEQVVEAPAEVPVEVPAPVEEQPIVVDPEMPVEAPADPGAMEQIAPNIAVSAECEDIRGYPLRWVDITGIPSRVVDFSYANNTAEPLKGFQLIYDEETGTGRIGQYASYTGADDDTLIVSWEGGSVSALIPSCLSDPVDPPPAPVKAYAEIEACAYNGMGEMVNFVVVHSSANDIAATFTYSNGVVAQKVLAQGRNAYDTLYGGSVRVDVPEAGYSVELALELVTSCSGYVPPKIEVVPTACIEASDGSFWASLEVTGPVGKGLEIQVGDSDRQAVTIGEEGLAFLALQPEVETPFYVWNGDIKVYEWSFKGVASCSPIPEEPPIVDPPAPPVVNPPVVNPPVEQPMQQPAQPPAEQPAEQPTASNDGGRGVPFETGTSNHVMIVGSMLVVMTLLGSAWGLAAPRRKEEALKP